MYPSKSPLVRVSVMLCISLLALSLTPIESRADDLASIPWPDGSAVLSFENAEGAVLVGATLTSSSGRDTSGQMLLDTGAGYLAVDLALARILGLADSASSAPAVGLAPRPLRRLVLGSHQVDQVYPVLTVDAGIVRRVTGRPVLGLLGQSLLRGMSLVVDYPSRTLVLLPPAPDPAGGPPGFRPALSPRAVSVPFRLAGDGKAVVPVRLAIRPGGAATELRFILDTGATKTVLFRSALDRRLPGWRSWPTLRGLGAPTLTGDARAEMVRVPRIEVGLPGASVARSGMDAAVIGGDLPRLLEESVGEPVDGLLGYSFLKHFRIVLDYPSGVLWLDAERGDVADRPGEFCHPGIQLESAGGVLRVMAVAVGSPAARAGIRTGDEVLAVDGEPVSGDDVIEVGRRLEGEPRSSVVLRLRRGSREWSLRVARAPLL